MNVYDNLIYSALNGSGGGGGGGSSYTLIASDEFDFSTTSTSRVAVKSINTGVQFRTADKMLFIRVYDKAGARDGYFTEHWVLGYDYEAANGGMSGVGSGQWARACIYKQSNGEFYVTTSEKGVFAYSLKRLAMTDWVEICAAASSSMAIAGTYVCEIYLIDYPNGNGPLGR